MGAFSVPSLATSSNQRPSFLPPRGSSARFSHPSAPFVVQGLVLRGGGQVELLQEAASWCNDLGAPSALVAGAVVATLYETAHSGNMEIQPDDSRLVAMGKKVTRFLLLSAFALETISIFVTSVTGTMLLSRPIASLPAPEVTESTTTLEFLRNNFEFEYLTARICFLQGLLNWLAAIGLDHAIPTGETPETRKVNIFVASSLLTTILIMLAFYNRHLTFYTNYLDMLHDWFSLLVKRFVWSPKPMALLVWPSLLLTLYSGYLALFDTQERKS